jgi:hypothetical protein
MAQSLFEDLPAGNSISVSAEPGVTCLTPAQVAFNQLIQQIGKKREQMAEWETLVSNFQQKYSADLLPILDAKNALKAEFVQRLDILHDEKGLSKVERQRIADMILDLAGELLAQRDDAELRVIYDKYHPIGLDQQEAERLAALKGHFADMTGMDLGDDLDDLSHDEFVERLRERMAAEQAAADQARAERQPKRKKTAKQLAKEQKDEEEAQQIKLSVREVYRKLASVLHPDRETDPQERERKTGLMQRANQAYEKNNLLQLLELQIELDHIDPSALNKLGEERLLRYNKTLKQQLSQLNAEKNQLEMNFRARFSIHPSDLGYNASPASVMRLLAQDIAAHQRDLHRMKRELGEIHDAKSVKMWLKAIRQHDGF